MGNNGLQSSSNGIFYLFVKVIYQLPCYPVVSASNLEIFKDDIPSFNTCPVLKSALYTECSKRASERNENGKFQQERKKLSFEGKP